MSSKTTVSQELGQALESLEHWDSFEIVRIHQHAKFSSPERLILNDMKTHEILKLIEEGYEIEKPLIVTGDIDTANVNCLVREFESREDADFCSYRDGINDGVLLALSQLNIKIRGINA